MNFYNFFAPILKPYRWYYLLMLQAPILGAFFIPLNNYALKLLIDNISDQKIFAFSAVIYPFAIFCFAAIGLETFWRIANFADYKSQPKIEAQIIETAFAKIINNHYQYFQNNLSGKIASKIAGLRDYFVQIQDLFMFQIITIGLQIIISVVMLFFVNYWLAILISCWLLFLLPTVFISKKKISILSASSIDKKQEMNGILNDIFVNFNTVFIFAKKNQEQLRLQNNAKQFIVAEKKRLKFLFVNHLFIGIIYVIMSISILFLLIKLRQQNLITNGELAMVFSLIYFTIDATWQLFNAVDTLLTAIGNLKQSFTVFTCQDCNIDKKNASILAI